MKQIKKRNSISGPDKTIHPIAHIHSDYKTKFGIPRQSGLTDQESRIVFEPEYANPDCFREIEGFSHLWLVWGFSANEEAGWSPTVRPPRLGGNRRVGVFASRSPFRPNGLGLSIVKLIRTEISQKGHLSLLVSGADLMDRSPIYDIKPYIPSSDVIPDARGGFTEKVRDRQLIVKYNPDLLDQIPKEKRDSLLKSLSLDPRPSYQNDPERIYGMRYAEYDVRFTIADQVCTIIELIR